MTNFTSVHGDTAGGTSGPDPDLIAAAVSGCALVARLSGGLAGEVATYLPGRRVTGVRVGLDRVSVHVVGRYGPPVAEIAGQVQDAVRPLAGDRTIEVVVDDLDVDPAEIGGGRIGPGTGAGSAPRGRG